MNTHFILELQNALLDAGYCSVRVKSSQEHHIAMMLTYENGAEHRISLVFTEAKLAIHKHRAELYEANDTINTNPTVIDFLTAAELAVNIFNRDAGAAPDIRGILGFTNDFT